MSDAEERATVVAVARSWLRTPYHHMGRVRGAGVDCLTLLAEVYAGAGVIARPEIPHYPPDWHLHRGAERYLDGLLSYCAEIAGPPLPADIVLWRFGRCFSHGAIVIEWPVVIHAYVGSAVRYEDAGRAAWLTHIGENVAERGRMRPRKLFRLRRWQGAGSSRLTASSS